MVLYINVKLELPPTKVCAGVVFSTRANNALEQALVKRGYQFVDDPAQADLLLSWHLATSLNRLFVQVLPAAAMLAASLAGTYAGSRSETATNL